MNWKLGFLSLSIVRRISVRRVFQPYTQTTIRESIIVQMSVCLYMYKLTWLTAEVDLERQRMIVGNADVAIVAGLSEKSLLS